VPKYRDSRSAVSAVIRRWPCTISLIRLAGTSTALGAVAVLGGGRRRLASAVHFGDVLAAAAARSEQVVDRGHRFERLDDRDLGQAPARRQSRDALADVPIVHTAAHRADGARDFDRRFRPSSGRARPAAWRLRTT